MWLGLSINPLSGHFISEHYLFASAEHQATRSYYGPLNFLMFNEGYHNEHHGKRKIIKYLGFWNYVTNIFNCFNSYDIIVYLNVYSSADFPYVPYSRLPLIKKIAAEFYEPLPCHTSWLRVLIEFLILDGIGPQSHAICSECTTRPELYRCLPTTVEFYEQMGVKGKPISNRW